VLLPVWIGATAWLLITAWSFRSLPGELRRRQLMGLAVMVTAVFLLTAPTGYPLRPLDPLVWGQVVELSDRKITPEAVDCYRLALQLNPASSAAAFHLGRALLLTGRRTEAEPILAAAWKKHPGFFELTAHYVGALLADGRPTQAQAVLEQSGAPDSLPQRFTYYGLLGEARLRLGDKLRAMDAFRQAMALAPDERSRRRLQRMMGSRFELWRLTGSQGGL
ncbi:MAG: tetratricopeptide repeat protein, partial [Victivallales bacterium]|nr:tetratricopeptide repeat protein [Victivallales bacterium]